MQRLPECEVGPTSKNLKRTIDAMNTAKANDSKGSGDNADCSISESDEDGSNLADSDFEYDDASSESEEDSQSDDDSGNKKKRMGYPKGAKMSAYEKLREKNIRERESLFKEVMHSKNLMVEAKKKAAAAKRALALASRQEKELLPPRKSARQAASRVSGPKFEQSVLTPFFDSMEIEEEYRGLGKDLAEVTSRLEKMMFRRVDGTSYQDPIGAIAIHPSVANLLVCYGGEAKGNIGFYLGKEKSHLSCKLHTAPVTCMSWNMYDPVQLVTSSMDGTVKIFDVNAVQDRVVKDTEDSIFRGQYAVHVQIDPHTLLVNQEMAGQGM